MERSNPALVSLLISAWIATFCLFFVLFSRWAQRRVSRERLFAEPSSSRPRDESHGQMRPLRQWLFLAGFRAPQAPTLFLATTCATSLLGALLALGLVRSGLQDLLLAGLQLMPGGTGELLWPIMLLAPWIFLVMGILLPVSVVSRTRKQRVEQTEQDLPLLLDLLATLCNAGLGFDAALDRILSTQSAQRPLAQEFRGFQADLLTGRARVEAFRRLAQRLEITSVTILISALVQAEQTGMGVAEILLRQADELRQRRREQASNLAMTLAVKRLFPLMICFLPGVFLWAIGPAFAQFLQYIDAFTRVRQL